MSMSRFLERLFARRGGIKLGIGRVRQAFAELNIPFDGTIYHVAGTNGKGSVVYAISHMLRSGGHRVGTFISPHIIDYNERILFNGKPISDEDVKRIFYVLESRLSESDELSFFEITFLIAWFYFAEQHADRVVFEVGLGGRLDATNVLPGPKCDVITSIGLDHTRILGEGLRDIAKEKVGIVQRGDTLFISSLIDDDIKDHIKEIAFSSGAAQVCEPFVEPESWPNIPLHSVQKENMRLAASAVIQTEGCMATTSLTGLVIPGRYEIRDGHVILDVAHNPPALEALASFVAEREDQPPILLYGAMKDKDIYRSLLPFVGRISALYLLQLDNDGRGALPQEISDRMPPELKRYLRVTESNAEAIAAATQEALRNEVSLVVTGSFFTVAEYVTLTRTR